MGKSKKGSKLLKTILVSSLSAVSLLIISGALFYFYFSNRIYPGVYIAGVNLGTLAPDQALSSVNQTLEQKTTPLTLTYSGNQYTLDLSSFKSSTNPKDRVDEAFSLGHSKFFLPFSQINLSLVKDSTPDLDSQIKNIAQAVNQSAISSVLKVEGGEISATPSSDGLILDEAALKSQILSYLNNQSGPPNSLPLKVVHPKLSYDAALNLKKNLDTIKLSPIKITFKSQNNQPLDIDPVYLNLDQILSLLDLENTRSSLASGNIGGVNWSVEEASIGDKNITDVHLALNKEKLESYLKGLSSGVNRDVKEPLLNFDASANGGKGRVTQFAPPTQGRSLDINSSEAIISNSLLSQNFSTISLPVNTVEPKNKLVNDLGIKELLGEGVSHFAGSIPNRAYNVDLTAQKLNGTLIAPGETFSFDQTIGDITAATGYKQAYVIKNGRTVLDDGGGVCQDSTTLFRAVLNAGLPITERTAHAYRVGYYEQGFPPGLDATVFYPSVDFKFKNDTSAHILIQAYTEGSTLVVDLYGTSDGRVATLTTPVVSSQTPPPDDLRQEDPTLPKGVVKQVDFSAWGANVSFTRIVQRAGQTIISETFRSNYRPWQAVFLVGTQ